MSPAGAPQSFGVSISISDGEDDSPIDRTARIRAQNRRRRRHAGAAAAASAGGGVVFRRRLQRFIRQWWPLVILLAFALVLLEASKLGRKARPFPPHRPDNLDRLSPLTRVVNGTKQPCLNLLAPEFIENLEFPASAERKSPIKTVLYKYDDSLLDDHIHHNSASRFNLFTGYQTILERDASFKVNETAEVHCGFYSENGGFKISDEDKNYMRTCKVVVSTCAFGGGDDLYQPIGMTEASINKVCYVAFWDEITRMAQEAEGNIIGQNNMIGRWRVVVVAELPFSDQRLNGKIPKMLSHRLFPNAKFSIWVDSKSQFRRDPIGVMEAVLWRTNSVLALSEHGARSSLYDEGKAVVKKNKATPEEVDVQLTQYRKDGIPEDKRFKGKKALAEASVIVREHTPSTNLFMCLWFNEVVRFTSRDQLSFPYVMRRLQIPGIYLFPVCTRKDLVNSLGHRRKVKPLTKDSR